MPPQTASSAPVTPQTAPKPYTVASFASALRTKYPTGVANDGTPYAKMSDGDLVTKVVTKYPTYASQIQDYKQPIPTSSPTTPQEPNLGQLTAQEQEAGGKEAAQGVEEGASELQSESQPDAKGNTDASATATAERTGSLLHAGAQSFIGAGRAIFAPVTAAIQDYVNKESDKPEVQAIANSKPVSDFLDAVNKGSAGAGALWDKVEAAHPALARAVNDSLGVAGTALGAEGGDMVKPNLSDVASTLKQGASDASDAVKSGVADVKTSLTPKPKAPVIPPVSQSIEAVNPDLSGKRLVSAYKGTVTGNQKITPPSMFQEQGLTPSQQTINLGTRLHDLGMTKDPVQNLGILGKAMSDTEGKIDTALEGDPEINYNADKPTLLGKLDDLKANMPGEFSAIKDSKNLFNHVVDFAKATIGKTEDTVKGIRTARTTFDTQAKAEYPSAFKGNGIDTSTPAGRAIKAVRDTMNEHLYNTAPNGSEIQNLIGRESDIYRAAENIAPKAAKGEGKNLIDQTLKAHPVLGNYLKYGLGLFGVDKIIKGTTGIGL